MSQPTQFLTKYVGSASIKKGSLYLGSGFSTSGNVLIMKTKKVSVSIGGNPMFLTSFDDYTYLDDTTTYVFDKDCVIAFGEMVEVV